MQLGEPQWCPNCLSKIDGVTSIKGETKLPGPGDISMCLYCLRLLVWLEPEGGDGWGPLAREEFYGLKQEERLAIVGAITSAALTDRPGPESRRVA